jgi:hypothetical protein
MDEGPNKCQWNHFLQFWYGLCGQYSLPLNKCKTSDRCKGFKLKDGSDKALDVYLGADKNQFNIPESDKPGKIKWVVFSSMYEVRATKETKNESENVGLGFLKRTSTPHSRGIHQSWIKQRNVMHSSSIVIKTLLVFCSDSVNLEEWRSSWCQTGQPFNTDTG